MLDFFGMSKVDAREAIQEISSGVVKGMLDSFDWKLMEKERVIDSLKQDISKLQNEIELLKIKLGEKNGEHKDSKQ